ncbi:hypothetical protein Hanom_Chr07g00617331 [Helianthus anomalus]
MTQEIVREWQAMGEDTLEFEAAKKEFAKEREAFNAEKKGLLWREWEAACECTNRELKTARDEIVKLKGEKTKQSDEYEHVVAVYQKRENEYTHRLANLEKVVAEKAAESKAYEILVEEISVNCKWLLVCGSICNMFELGEAAYNSGRKDGYGEVRAAAAANEKDYHFEFYKEDCTVAYAAKHQEYEFLEFSIVKSIEKLSRKSAAVETLKKALGDQDMETAEAGSSQQG